MKPYFETKLGKLYHGDCLEIMPQIEPVDLVLTDPPYGIGAGREKPHNGWCDYGISDWDLKRPPKACFDKILSASEIQIIWGGNYFTDYLKPTMQWFVWDKRQREFSLADCEFAWSSQKKASRIFNYSRAEALRDKKVHPTQKPIAVMVWTLNQVQKASTILDPFLGSGTTAIACERLKRKWIGIEISEEYCAIAAKRIENEIRQLKLF